METRALVFRNWDDLVFDNRNQAYGAYLIRRAYSRRLLLSFGVSVAMAALVLLVPILLKNDAPTSVLPEIPKGIIEITPYTPPVVPKFSPPAAIRPTESVRTNTTPIIVQDDVPVTNDVPSVTPVSDVNGTGESTFSDFGSTTGTGISTPVEPVAVVPTDPVVFAEVMPEYEGGMAAIMKFVKKHLIYSSRMRRMEIDGTVYVSFVVNGDGSVSSVTVLRGIHKDCDEEAARVIGMLPGWKGGKQGGMPVRVKMVLPIRFSLQ